MKKMIIYFSVDFFSHVDYSIGVKNVNSNRKKKIDYLMYIKYTFVI